MGATKATLIVVGTVVGTGAVLAYSPPHHTLTLGGGSLGGGSLGGGRKSTPTPTPTPSEVSTPAPTPTPVASTPAPVKTNTPAPTKSTKKPVTPKKTTPPTVKLANGPFTGDPASAEHGGTVYGLVQVRVTMTNSVITGVSIVQAPQGPVTTDINAQALPILIQQTLASTSHVGDITGVSQASATSQAFYDSLTSAIAKAGAKAVSNAGL